MFQKFTPIKLLHHHQNIYIILHYPRTSGKGILTRQTKGCKDLFQRIYGELILY